MKGEPMTDTRRIAMAIQADYPRIDGRGCLSLAAQLGKILDKALAGGWDFEKLQLAAHYDKGTELSRTLKELRHGADLSIRDVVSESEWSTSKLNHIESGVSGISITDLRFLLRLYRVTDQRLISHLENLARDSQRRRRR